MISFQRLIGNTPFEKPDDDWDASEQTLEKIFPYRTISL
jgi:hypothetical protein